MCVCACACNYAGATTNSDSGVTDILKVVPTLKHMAHMGMPLLVHGEVTDPSVDIFDREAVFIQTKLVRGPRAISCTHPRGKEEMLIARLLAHHL